jgi:hypothetical protein
LPAGFSVGKSEPANRFSQQRLQLVLAAPELLGEGAIVEYRAPIVGIQVGSDLVAAPARVAQDFSVVARRSPDHEERPFGRDAVERVEHLRGPSRMGTVVEGERDFGARAPALAQRRFSQEALYQGDDGAPGRHA